MLPEKQGGVSPSPHVHNVQTWEGWLAGLGCMFSSKQLLTGPAASLCLLRINPSPTFPQHCRVPDPRLLGVRSVPVQDSDLGSIMYNVLDI